VALRFNQDIALMSKKVTSVFVLAFFVRRFNYRGGFDYFHSMVVF
jgi:hypothetical protein